MSRNIKKLPFMEMEALAFFLAEELNNKAFLDLDRETDESINSTIVDLSEVLVSLANKLDID